MKFKVKKGASVVQNGSLVKFKNSEFETEDKELIEILRNSLVAKADEAKPVTAKASSTSKSKPKLKPLVDDEDF